jgi:hypothetical protein
MPIDMTDRIETGRSWRDLPSHPPLQAPTRPVTEREASTIVADEHVLPWARIGVGVAALVIGVAVGLWAPWASTDQSTDLLPQSAEQLPDQIVPENRDDLTPVVPAPDTDPGIVPDGFGSAEQFFDQLPDDFLDQLPPGLFEDLPGTDGSMTPGLITLPRLPVGYQIRSNVYSGTNSQASQRVRLLGPGGAVDIQAIRGPDVAMPEDGQPHMIGEIDARIQEASSSTTISWLANDDLLITIEAPASVPTPTLDAIAAAVETSP